MYGYDKAGNRISLSEGAFSLGTVTVTSTQNYGYNNASWGDLITSINGNTVTYDPMGNPLTYYTDGLDSVLTWTNGRQLASYENMDGLRTYTYNDEGIRISKTVGGVEHKYQLNGTQIVSETWGIHTIFYIYDENGSIAGMRYRTSSYTEGVFDEYFFEKNLQGDVVAVYNALGTKLISYKYDAWGNFTTTYHNGGASTGAVNNPFRYRGYYYDSDTGLYYLNSRYYDPVTGRFISADIYVSTGQGIIGHNMYAYCNNNPVMFVDYYGDSATAEVYKSVTALGSILSVLDNILPIGELIFIAGMIGVACTATDVLDLPSVSKLEKEKTEEKEKTKEKEIKQSPKGTTYYHVTTRESAAAIMMTGVMCGSSWEGGHVYAWRTIPSPYAIKKSGAHYGVIISFKTSASFAMDIGIVDPKVQIYGPVVSILKGPIVVWDVKILGV